MVAHQSAVLIVLSILLVVGAFWALYATHPRTPPWPTDTQDVHKRRPRWIAHRRSLTP